MGRRGTFLLALLVAVSGAYVWFDATRSATSGDRPPGPPIPGAVTPGAPPLLTTAPDSVTRVRLRQGTISRDAHRQDGAWVPERAAGLLKDMLQSLAHLPVIAEITTATDDLGAYGLDPPHGTLEVYAAETASPVILEIGDRNPPGSAVYVRLGDPGRVVLAGELVRHDFDRTFAALAE